MPNYVEGAFVLFYHKPSSQNALRGMIQRVIPSGDDSPSHYNILCEELQCELFVSESDVVDMLY